MEIIVFKAKVILDPIYYGKPLCWRHRLGWYWKFCSPQYGKKIAIVTEPIHAINTRINEGETNLVTIEDSWVPILIAVTPKRHKGWAKQDITYEHNWTIINWIIKLHKMFFNKDKN